MSAMRAKKHERQAARISNRDYYKNIEQYVKLDMNRNLTHQPEFRPKRVLTMLIFQGIFNSDIGRK